MIQAVIREDIWRCGILRTEELVQKVKIGGGEGNPVMLSLSVSPEGSTEGKKGTSSGGGRMSMIGESR